MMAFPDPSFKPETPASHEAVWDSVLHPGKGPFRGAQYKVLSPQVRNIKFTPIFPFLLLLNLSRSSSTLHLSLDSKVYHKTVLETFLWLNYHTVYDKVDFEQFDREFNGNGGNATPRRSGPRVTRLGLGDMTRYRADLHMR